MLNVFRYPENWEKLIDRPKVAELNSVVSDVIEHVKHYGDQALAEYAERFDGVKLDTFLVSEEELAEADCEPELKEAIETACGTITTFHASQREPIRQIETAFGVSCFRKSVPIEKVGLYIPGGRAPLFSTVLMLAIPAKVAGCKEIVLCTPPDKAGKVNPTILYTAKTVGVTKIFKVGGAQAIAALAYGTESIPKVDKIFGPGNQYVTCAKSIVSSKVAIDMPAGPSEVLVIADAGSRAEFVAADLLSQAEHGPDSQVVFLTDSETMLEAVQVEVFKQLSQAPRREIMEQSLVHSRFILLKSLTEAIIFSNLYAPEHLILAVREPEKLAEQVNAAGSVFLGDYAAESFGDYAAGVNHTLPTSGFARAYSGVSLDSFIKKITFQTITPQGVNSIGKAAEMMAKAEGLYGHANALSLRLAAVNQHASETSEEKLSFSVRNNINNLTPYVCARHEFQGQDAILLDANENSLGSVSDVLLNRYPDPYQVKIKTKLADIKDTNVDNILLTNGSDEAIDLLIRAYCNPQYDEILIMPPTYGMYEVSAAINDVNIKRVNLVYNEITGFQIDVKNVLENISPLTKIIFICTPNNPTANNLRHEDIEIILNKFHGLVVVDEAYIDFADVPSFINNLKVYSNLVVLQTFSKAWGMAGVRLGVIYAASSIINIINSIKPPYNINELTSTTVLDALSKLKKKEAMQDAIILEREKLAANLAQLGVKVFPSNANFLLIKVPDAAGMYNYLKEHGVIVRDRSKTVLCENCLRITVGSPQENEFLVKLCREYVK